MELKNQRKVTEGTSWSFGAWSSRSFQEILEASGKEKGRGDVCGGLLPLCQDVGLEVFDEWG